MSAGDQIDFQRIFLEFLDRRAREMGSEMGGLQHFYLRRLEQKRLMQKNEETASAAILAMQAYDAYVEIGAGFGQMAWWLAINGLRCVAIERDTSRFGGLQALQALVADHWPETGNRMHALLGSFPCDLPEIVDPRQSLVISTNLIHSASYEREQEIIAGMASYSGALVDTLRFCRDRTTGEELADLDARFASYGLMKRKVWQGDERGERVVWYHRDAPPKT